MSTFERHTSLLRGSFIPLLLLTMVCSLLVDTDMLHADRHATVVYDAALDMNDLQRLSPALVQSSGTLKIAPRLVRHLLPVLLFALHFGFSVCSAPQVRGRLATLLRKSEVWGLLPFSLAPPRFA